MSFEWLLQLTLFALVGLSKLAAAGPDAANYAQVDQQPIKPAHWGEMPLMGEVLSACDSTISCCGKQAKVKIIYEAKSTTYKTNPIVKWTTATLSTATSTVTEVSFVTVTTSTEGHCRETTTITNDEILEITVDVHVTSTEEFVPINWVTTVEVSTISQKALEQCIVTKPCGSCCGAPTSVPSPPLYRDPARNEGIPRYEDPAPRNEGIPKAQDQWSKNDRFPNPDPNFL